MKKIITLLFVLLLLISLGGCNSTNNEDKCQEMIDKYTLGAIVEYNKIDKIMAANPILLISCTMNIHYVDEEDEALVYDYEFYHDENGNLLYNEWSGDSEGNMTFMGNGAKLSDDLYAFYTLFGNDGKDLVIFDEETYLANIESGFTATILMELYPAETKANSCTRNEDGSYHLVFQFSDETFKTDFAVDIDPETDFMISSVQKEESFDGEIAYSFTSEYIGENKVGITSKALSAIADAEEYSTLTFLYKEQSLAMNVAKDLESVSFFCDGEMLDMFLDSEHTKLLEELDLSNDLTIYLAYPDID